MPSASCRRCRCSSASRPRSCMCARPTSRSSKPTSPSAIRRRRSARTSFTAVDYQPGGRDMRWNVVSIAGRQPGEPEKSSGMNQRKRNQSVGRHPDGCRRGDCCARPDRDPARDRRAHHRAGAAGLFAHRLRRGRAQGDGQGDRLHRADQRRTAGRHRPAAQAARLSTTTTTGYNNGPFGWGYDNRRRKGASVARSAEQVPLVVNRCA